MVSACVYIYMCTDIYIYIYMYIHMYTHIFKRNRQNISKEIFYFPPAIYELSSIFVSSLAFSFVTVFYFICSNRYIVITHHGLNFNSLIASSVVHPFMCLFTICISSSMKYLCMCLAHFLIGPLFIF